MRRRVLIKLSGEYLAGAAGAADAIGATDDTGVHYDAATVGRIADEIMNIRAADATDAIGATGAEVCLVTGGGNFWRGADAPAAMDRVRADHIGMLASVMNGIYLADLFINRGVAARVLTPFGYGPATEVYDRDAADAYLKNGELLIFAGGTGHPFFSTDTAAAIRAAELNVGLLLYAKGVEGVCDRDPRHGGGYHVYREMTYNMIIRDNLTVVDIVAAELLRQRKVYSILFDIRVAGAMEAAFLNDGSEFEFGTKIYWDKTKSWEEEQCRKKRNITKTK